MRLVTIILRRGQIKSTKNRCSLLYYIEVREEKEVYKHYIVCLLFI